ncbi:MAG: aldehyde dehydrogenase family protein, partial [Bdellovibrionales bacterium]|nr:aldehyde dehydrogenase family protein [Bdellovibrionales bacterium]
MTFKGDFINGVFLKTEKPDGEFKDISPADLSDHLMTVTFKHEHIDEACSAAKKAFHSWAHLPIEKRKEYLIRLKELFVTHEADMAKAISRDTGKPMWDATTEAKALAGKIDITLNFSSKLIQEERITNALPQVDGVIRYKPRGVMSVIGPFNFPAHLPNGHIIPALYSGNTVVFKPSEQTPYVGQLYTELIEKAQFPPGVFNMVQGDG